MKKLFVLLVLLLFLPVISQAQAPVVGGTGNTLPKGFWYIENHFLGYHFDEAWKNGSWVKLPKEKQVFLNMNFLQIYKSLADKFNLRFNLPLYLECDNGINKYHNLPGDVILDSKIRLHYVKEGRIPFSFSLIPGLSFATGDKRLRPFDSDKSFLDFFNGYNLTAKFSAFTLHNYLLYWFKTSDIDDYWQYNVAINISLSSQFDLCLELNGKHWMGSLDGKRWLDFCPGMQFYPGGKKTPGLEIALMYPVDYKAGLKSKNPGIYAGFGYYWK